MNNCTNIINNSPGYSYIEIMNNAGYIVRFSVTYSLRGKTSTYRSREFSLLQSDKIYIPNEATFIAMKIEEEAFIGKWAVFYAKFSFKPFTKCYSVTGTILTPKATQIPCYGSYSKGYTKEQANKCNKCTKCIRLNKR